MESAERYARIKAGGGFADLSARAKFRLTGGDRVRYLNGQVTNDVRKLRVGESLYACVTTAKGKMCGDIFITAATDFLLLDAEPSLRESLSARLERYIIADDVTLEDVTEEFAILHTILPLGAHAPPFPESEKGGAFCLRNRFVSPPSDLESYDLILPRAAFAKVWRESLSQGNEIDAQMQETLRLEAGIPRWGFELTEETLPPEAGLDATAIDYHKGCYIGQETISRIRSVGHVNRTLRGFVSDAPLRLGMLLFHDEKSVGVLTSTGFSFGLDTPMALGYLKRGVDASVLTARHPDGGESCVVHVRELPLC